MHLREEGWQKRSGETSKRLAEDSYARLKYEGTAQQDKQIIDRIAELAERKKCIYDGNFFGMAAYKVDSSGGWGN